MASKSVVTSAPKGCQQEREKKKKCGYPMWYLDLTRSGYPFLRRWWAQELSRQKSVWTGILAAWCDTMKVPQHQSCFPKTRLQSGKTKREATGDTRIQSTGGQAGHQPPFCGRRLFKFASPRQALADRVLVSPSSAIQKLRLVAFPDRALVPGWKMILTLTSVALFLFILCGTALDPALQTVLSSSSMFG